MSYEFIGNYQPTSTWPSTRNGLSCIETGLIPITEINRTKKTVISESAQVFRFDTTGTTSEAEQFRYIQELFEKGERDLAFSTMDELLDVMATPSNYLRALRVLLRQGEAYTARLLAVKAHKRFLMLVSQKSMKCCDLRQPGTRPGKRLTAVEKSNGYVNIERNTKGNGWC